MEHVAESCQGGKTAVVQRHVNMTKYVHRKNQKLATFLGFGRLGCKIRGGTDKITRSSREVKPKEYKQRQACTSKNEKLVPFLSFGGLG